MSQQVEFHVTQFGVGPEGSIRVIMSGLPAETQGITVRVEKGTNRRSFVPARPEGWESNRFPWPFAPMNVEIFSGDFATAKVRLEKTKTRWGTYWIASEPLKLSPGFYHLETDDPVAVSMPFEVGGWIHDRILDGFLLYLRNQRSGEHVPGRHSPIFLDDAVSDIDGSAVIGVGGWFDAGDCHRQWSSTTALNLGVLTEIALAGPEPWKARALDELEWGRDYFTHLAADGIVPDNIGGGVIPEGEYTIDDWWFENHAGTMCDGSGSIPTDDIPGTGDERIAMMYNNPHGTYTVARELALSCHAGPLAKAARARTVAERIWRKSADQVNYDHRTLFLASKTRAAVALSRLTVPIVSTEEIVALADELLTRQAHSESADGISGYFMEYEGGSEPFRAIPYSCEPALALLDAFEVVDPDSSERYRAALTEYIDRYLLLDAQSNPFGIPPYGVYDITETDPRQDFRPVCEGRGVRTFMAPFNDQFIVHGTGAVILHQCYLLARAGRQMNRPDWIEAAERLLQWNTGANPDGLSLITSLGYRRPIPDCPKLPTIPGAVLNGYIGWPEDTPYMETSNAINWNTQEVYGVPSCYVAQAALWISGRLVAPLTPSGDPDSKWL